MDTVFILHSFIAIQQVSVGFQRVATTHLRLIREIMICCMHTQRNVGQSQTEVSWSTAVAKLINQSKFREINQQISRISTKWSFQNVGQ